MFTLFVRTIVIYFMVFAVLRLMGKRQISDMQPFDLVITLLIADVASVPISDSAIPLIYGAVPILTLFILHRFVAFISLKSNRVRRFVCGSPIVIIEKGVVLENAMRAANYTLGDLTEQLRIKDVFSISQVEYGILETNGSLSVLQKSGSNESAPNKPSSLIVSDGRILRSELEKTGIDEKKLKKRLGSKGGLRTADCFFVMLDPDGTLHVQEKQKKRRVPSVHFIKGAG